MDEEEEDAHALQVPSDSLLLMMYRCVACVSLNVCACACERADVSERGV